MSVFKRGKTYWVEFRFNHIRCRKRSPENSLAGAKTFESLLRMKLARGEPINEKPKVKVPTFSEFSDKWFDTYVKTNNKPSEQDNKEMVFRIHLKPFFGRKPLDQINNLMIEEYKAKKQAQGICNKSINNQIGMLGKCLRCAEEWEVITKVPRIKPLKVPPQTFKFLSEEEYDLLLEASKQVSIELYEMILFTLRTGLRIGELIAVKWEDINYDNQSILIARTCWKGEMGSPKSNRTRQIPLADDLYNLLYQRRQKEGFIFLNQEGEIYSRFALDRALDRACKLAGIKIVSWHPLRHTFASKLANNGVALHVIQALLGHSDLKMTQRYAHLEPLTLSEAIKTLEPKNNLELFRAHKMPTNAEIPVKFEWKIPN